MEVLGAVPNRARAKRWVGVQPWVSRHPTAKPDIRRKAVRRGDGVGTKFCVLTRGDLSASAFGMVPAVVVEDKRTRRRWDERSRRVQ